MTSKKHHHREIHILYIVFLPEKRLTKIGITRRSNFHSRMRKIRRNFGEIDRGKSYIFYSEDGEEIYNLEQLLHRFFYLRRKRLAKGSGKTEWFDLSSKGAVSVAKKIIDDKNAFPGVFGPFFMERKKVSALENVGWRIFSVLDILVYVVLGAAIIVSFFFGDI